MVGWKQGGSQPQKEREDERGSKDGGVEGKCKT